MSWEAISKNDLEKLVNEQLSECSSELKGIFEKYKVSFQIVPIRRFGNIEEVYIIARKDDEVLYYEDIEEGFEVSLVDSEGMILERKCNQYSLSMVLHQWLQSN